MRIYESVNVHLVKYFPLSLCSFVGQKGALFIVILQNANKTVGTIDWTASGAAGPVDTRTQHSRLTSQHLSDGLPFKYLYWAAA